MTTPDPAPVPPAAPPRRVLGVPRANFPVSPWPMFQGFRPASAAHLIPMLAGAEFRDKAAAETDESFKQIIPYVILTHGRSVFTYRRAGGEGRLDGKVSIGVGGHVEQDDHEDAWFLSDIAVRGQSARVMNLAIEIALRRELAEEIEVRGYRRGPGVVGLINDDSDPVGRVHLGIVYHAELASPDVRPGPDGEITGGKFWPASSLIEWAGMQPDVFEGWTRAAIDGWAKPWAAKG